MAMTTDMTMEVDTPTSTPTPTKKSKKTNPLGPTPASYEEANETDKLIVRLKEKEGKSWAEIKNVLETATGVSFGGSTLPVRYSRMKANFVVFDKEDVGFLFFVIGAWCVVRGLIQVGTRSS